MLGATWADRLNFCFLRRGTDTGGLIGEADETSAFPEEAPTGVKTTIHTFGREYAWQ